MKENREQRFSRLHDVVILLPEQQTEPAAQVSDLLQLGAVPPQEAPHGPQTVVDVFNSLKHCHKITQVKEILAHVSAPTCWQNSLFQRVQEAHRHHLREKKGHVK